MAWNFSSIESFLSAIGAMKRNGRYVLDGFSSEFYIVFDTTDNPERPDTWGTADVMFAHAGSDPRDSERRFCVKFDANVYDIMRILAAIGINHFGPKVKDVYYSISNPLRDEERAKNAIDK